MENTIPLPEVASIIHVNDLSARDARALAFQLLYTTDSFDNEVSLASVVDNYNRGFEVEIPFDSAIVSTVAGIMSERDRLDEIYKPLLSNWRFDRLGYCTKLILRFAVWELLHTDLSPTIIMNEAIELAKCFAEKDAYKFINGILDEAATQIRVEPVEAI